MGGRVAGLTLALVFVLAVQACRADNPADKPKEDSSLLDAFKSKGYYSFYDFMR